MTVKLPTTRRGIVLGVALAVAIPLASFTAGYLAGGPATAPAALQTVAMTATPPSEAAESGTPEPGTAAPGTGKPDAAVASTVQPATPKAAERPIVREVAVKSGDNLMGILVRAGVDRGEAHAAITALNGVYNPRRDLNVGDRLQLTLWPAGVASNGKIAETDTIAAPALDGLVLPVSYDRDVAVARRPEGGFSASEIERPLIRTNVRTEGAIDSSLFVDGRNAGLPIGVLVELIRIYSFDVDFQREIQQKDRFEVMFSQFRDEAGKPVHNGDISYAKLTLSNTPLPLYRYKTTAGNLDWFNAKGESVRKTLMRTPIDGARLSSRFGMRKHPVLGYSRMHTGTDFAAPSGTPIYAAGSGSIAEIGTKGGYGKYVRIRHNSNYDTAYAHMRAYARGMTRGKRVKQGQVIGYVGTTGRSTGPHLHYEVLRDNRKINPLTLKLPSGEKLKGKELERFAAVRDAADRTFAGLARATIIAGNESDTVSCGGTGAPARAGGTGQTC